MQLFAPTFERNQGEALEHNSVSTLLYGGSWMSSGFVKLSRVSSNLLHLLKLKNPR